MTTLFDAAQMNQLSSTFIGTGRNRIINGDMTIDQQNGGTSVTVNSTSSFFGVDLWKGGGTTSEGVYTMQRQTTTPPTGFGFYTRLTTTTAAATPAAASDYRFQQSIESNVVRDMLTATGINPVNISFWVRSSLTGTFSGWIQVGSSSNRTYVYPYSIPVANTWTKISVALPADNGATSVSQFGTSTGINLGFDLGAGSNQEGTANVWTAGSSPRRIAGTVRLISTNAATLDFTGIQLELGIAATPFEFIPFALELMLCQRYFEKSYDPDTAPGTVTNSGLIRVAGGQIAGGTVNYNDVWFFVPKRAAPTMLFWTNSGTAGQLTTVSQSGGQTNRTPTANGYNIKGWNVTATTTDAFMFGHFTADARL